MYYIIITIIICNIHKNFK